MWSLVQKRCLQVGFFENLCQMGRTRSQKKTGPASVRHGTYKQGSAIKRPANCLKLDAHERSSVKRKVLRTMPPVKSPISNGDGGEPLDAVAGKASDAAAAASPRHFRFTDIMEKKLNGGTWTKAEIEWFISEIVKEHGQIEDSQIGAFLMCTFIKGLDAEETACLTEAMMLSGDTLSWPKEWDGKLVDKHSTGGVGDKVSLILAPALAACGMKVPMISGRGLGHTGGTLDKLESIPGYTVLLQSDRMHKIMEDVGCCICGQTANLVPADKKLYAIRDVTSTVASLPLITGSIISKKAAERVNALVLDVKVGKSAVFSQDETLGKEMAKSLVTASSMLGTKATALMTRMDNPIGCCIGNTLEVAESIQCLHGKGPTDLRTLVEELGGYLIDSLTQGTSNGKQQISDTLDDGTALAKFQDMIIAQGVDRCLAERLCRLPMHNIDEVWKVLTKAECETHLKAEKTGYISSINSLELAKVCLELGAGRAVATADVDHSVGVNLLAHVGSHVKKGEPWITVYHQSSDFTEKLASRLQATLEYSDHKVSVPNIIIDVVRPS